MDRKELIRKYLEFFKSKGHVEIPNSSLIPENDPSLLFTTAGMQPLVPYLLGEKHPLGTRLTGVQRCIRTTDIEAVGDTYHHTFFEMLGNWSLGNYFKKEAIGMSFEFLTGKLKIPVKKIAVTVFAGNKKIAKDDEAAKVWKNCGVADERIAYLDNNWWETAGPGPCGPDTEMFYWKDFSKETPAKFNPNDENWVEIWNDVLMEYEKTKDGEYVSAKQKNIDTGMGIERTIAVLQGYDDNYLTEVWKPIIEKIEALSEKKYNGNEREMRIVADHVKAAVFLIADGVVPGNAEQSYVLRRLIRRAIVQGRKLGLENFTTKVAEPIFEIYDDYNLDKKKILVELKKEEEKFLQTLDKGMKILKAPSLGASLRLLPPKILVDGKEVKPKKNLSGKEAFLLYQSYGFPIEMTREIAKEKGMKIDEESFQKELEKHQELSRTASAGKFKSGLADNSEATTQLHTACHLLNEALREVLKKPDISQKGANITPERLRFDFGFDRKLTPDEIQKVENWVNGRIEENLPVKCEEMNLDEARRRRAHGIFDSKYGEKVRVYFVGDVSKEICAGPHVKNTGELGTFKITKETSSSSGVRRIKAVLE